MSIELLTYERLVEGGEEITYIVDRLIPEKSLGHLYAPSGVGKSLVALAAAHSIASGRPFLGLRTQQGRVVYIAGEGGPGLGQRATAWCLHEGVESPGEVRYVTHPVRADTVAEVTELLEEVHRAFGAPKLLIIDTLQANASPGFDENDARDMNLLVAGARRLILETGCSVLLVHHTGWLQTRERGSTVLRAACDYVLKLERMGRRTVKLCVDKGRDFDDSLDLMIELVPSGKSLVPVLSNRPATLSDAQLGLLRVLQESSQALKAKDWLARSAMGRTTFYDLKAKLLADELVAQNEREAFYPTPKGQRLVALSGESAGLSGESGRTGSVSVGDSPSVPCVLTHGRRTVPVSALTVHERGQYGEPSHGEPSHGEPGLSYEEDERRGLQDVA